jgi:hypothetical protein
MSVPSMTRSDATGLFQLEGVSPGTYRILATVGTGINSENTFGPSVSGRPAGAIAEVPGVPVRVTDGNVGGLRIVVPGRP